MLSEKDKKIAKVALPIGIATAVLGYFLGGKYSKQKHMKYYGIAIGFTLGAGISSAILNKTTFAVVEKKPVLK